MLVACDEEQTAARLPQAIDPALCVGGTEGESAYVVTAVAPPDATESLLGRPVDRDFSTLIGPAGASIFNENQVIRTPVNITEHISVTIDNTEKRKSSSGVFLAIFGSKSRGSKEIENRYAYYQAQQLTECISVDETAEFRDVSDDAVFFVSKFCTGHSYTIMVSGQRSKFHKKASGGFLFFKKKASDMKESYDLDVRFSARGLKPKDEEKVTFARSLQEIQDNYEVTGEGNGVPVFIEYRSIPRRCVPRPELIRWNDPSTVNLSFESLRVYNRGHQNWTLKATCRNNRAASVPIDNPEVYNSFEVNDACESDGEAGPLGGTTFCAYDPGWNTEIPVTEGDVITCGIEGTANDDVG
ncbi:MAG: hypothetical protein AAFU66_09635, partial [Pseudomonadota bacterium]